MIPGSPYAIAAAAWSWGRWRPCRVPTVGGGPYRHDRPPRQHFPSLARLSRARAREVAGNQRPWPADKVERWAIDRLIPYAKNARTHTDAQIAAIAASIKEWGWTTPALVGEDGGLIAGHARSRSNTLSSGRRVT